MQNHFIIRLMLIILVDGYVYSVVRSKWKNAYLPYIWWIHSSFMLAGISVSILGNLNSLFWTYIWWLFCASIFAKISMVPFFILDDVRRISIWIKRKLLQDQSPEAVQTHSKNDPISRSEFLIKTGVLLASIPISSLGYGTISSAYDYRIRYRSLHLPNLPKAFDGIRLGQLSDIHAGSFYDPKAVKHGVDLLLKEKTDFIFFTGDLVNNLASEMSNYQDVFAKLHAPLGVFSVLGNHDYGDYYFGKSPSIAKEKNLTAIKTIHKNMGWDLLLNRNHRLKIDGEEIAILGVENWGTGRFPRYGCLDLALRGAADVPIKLLLSHDPSHWRAQVLKSYPAIDVMFSGHTHGMQFGLLTEKMKWSPIQYVYKEWAGLYQEKSQQLYVNAGYGFLGYPGRVGILPEITIFELKQGPYESHS